MHSPDTTMAAEIETLNRIYDAINRNDIDGMTRDFDPAIVRIEPEGFPTSGTYRGIDAIKAQFIQARNTWAEGSCTITEHVVAGDHIILRVKIHVRLKDKADWIDGEVGDLWTFRNGKAIYFRTFAEFGEATRWLASAGGSRE